MNELVLLKITNTRLKSFTWLNQKVSVIHVFRNKTAFGGFSSSRKMEPDRFRQSCLITPAPEGSGLIYFINLLFRKFLIHFLRLMDWQMQIMQFAGKPYTLVQCVNRIKAHHHASESASAALSVNFRFLQQF
jgi:hypothetical protein